MSASDRDGGYYAIKGFLFQFDKTIIEILQNPAQRVMIEHVEDIDYDQFAIQVKHHEKTKYSRSRIRKPVSQLLGVFRQNKLRRLRLYCHFADKAPAVWQPDVAEIKDILGISTCDSREPLLAEFSASFCVEFSSDFDTQFEETLDVIRQGWGCDRDTAVIYHSIIRSFLLDIAKRLNTRARSMTFSELRTHIDNAEEVVVYGAYARYLARGKYERLIKDRYFKSKTVNLENFQRLFVFEIEGSAKITVVQSLIKRLRTRFFRPGKSPAPYVCFRLDSPNLLNEVKTRMVNSGLKFDDGTYFHGDELHVDLLSKRSTAKDGPEIRFVNVADLPRLASALTFDVVYDFYATKPVDFPRAQATKRVAVQISDQDQAVRILD